MPGSLHRRPYRTRPPRSRYPKVEAKTAQELNVYARDHLMGTRTSFVALDWGRNPSAFEVHDVRRDEDGKTVKLQLALCPTRMPVLWDQRGGDVRDHVMGLRS